MNGVLQNLDCSTDAGRVGTENRHIGSKWRWRQYLLYQCCCLTALFFTACGEGNQSALDPAGTQGDRWSRLWWFVYWICTAVFIIVMIAFIVALVRGRQNRQQPEVG